LFEALAGDAELVVEIAQAGGARASEPAGDPAEALHQREEHALGVGHAFLHQDHARVADVLRPHQVGAMKYQIVVVTSAALVDLELVVVQILEAAAAELVATD